MATKDNAEDAVLDFKTSDGQHFHQECVGWSGYFDQFEYVNVTPVVIGKKEKL